MEKGEAEGKTLLDAMRVGTTEGMQHFDGEIEKLIRAGAIGFETGMGYATNPGNLRLELADFVEIDANAAATGADARAAGGTTETRLSSGQQCISARLEQT